MPRSRSIRTSVAAVALLGIVAACSSTEEHASSNGADPTAAVEVEPGPVPTLEPVVERTSVWPVALHDVRHSGQAPVLGPTTGRLRWIRRLEGNVTPGPVVGADGTIYLASNAGVLHALDPLTGSDRWTLDADTSTGGDLSSSPAVLGSGVIVWPVGQTLRGVSPAGEQLWSLDLGASPTSPMPAGDRVFVMTMDGVLHGIGLGAGDRSATEDWSVDIGTSSYASPAISPDGTIITNAGSDVAAVVDRGDHGDVVWRRPLGTLSEISPAVAPDGTIVSGGNDRWIQTFSAKGEPLGRLDRETESYSSPIVTASDIVVQGNHRAAVVGFDLATGQRRLLVRRRVKQPGRTVGVWTAPVLDRVGNVYFGTRSGRIVGFSWAGALLFDIDAGVTATIDSYPALTADGALIVGDTDGVVRAIADDGALPADTRPPAAREKRSGS